MEQFAGVHEKKNVKRVSLQSVNVYYSKGNENIFFSCIPTKNTRLR